LVLAKENNENAYTRENRKKMYQEMEKERLDKEKKDNPEKFKEKVSFNKIKIVNCV